MAFLPGIFNRQPAAGAAGAAGAAPVALTGQANGSAGPAGQQQQPANPAAAPQNMAGQPAAPAAGGPQTGAASGMDAFIDIFKPAPVNPNAPKQLGLNDPILGAMDPAAFRQQIATTNFAASIPADRVQAALGGDVQAFNDVLNMAMREAFTQSAQLSHGLVEHGVRTGAERVNGSLDSRIRNINIKGQNTSNEALNHPAVAPMMSAVKMQIAQSNPNLSAEQVQQQAEQYFTQMADVLVAPKQAAAAQAVKPTGVDFSSYIQ